MRLYKEQEKSIFAVFSIFVCQIIASFVLPYFNVRQSVRQLIIYCVCMAIPIILLSKFGCKMKISCKMPHRPVLSFFACLGIMCLSDRVCTAISNAFLEFGIQLSADVTLYDVYMPADIIVSFITLVILPPLAEEVIFRGLVQNKLLVYGRWQAIVFSSLLFAFFHMNILQIPYAFVCGMLFGYFTAQTGSVFFSAVLHFVNNLSAFVIMYTGASETVLSIYSAALILIGALSVFLLLKGKKINPPCLSLKFICPFAYIYFIISLIFAFGGVKVV